jgi:hypothetical protein
MLVEWSYDEGFPKSQLVRGPYALVVKPQVMKVAETLDEFRGRYRYNPLDENVRRFNAEVPCGRAFADGGRRPAIGFIAALDQRAVERDADDR